MVYYKDGDPRWLVIVDLYEGRVDEGLARCVGIGGVDIMIENGSTLLHDAIDEKSAELVRRILDEGAPRSLDSVDEFDRTPLVAAAESGQEECVVLLLQAGAEVDSSTTAVVDSALKRAVEGCYLSIVELLVNAGANPDKVGWGGLSPRDVVTTARWQARHGAENGEKLYDR